MSLIQNGAGESATKFYNEVAQQSVRFPVGEPHLQRTPGTSGNQKRWTSSFWVKRTKLGSMYLWSGASYSGNDGIAAIYFDSDQLHVYYDGSSATYGAIGPDLYRDLGAWYHIVWAVDAVNTEHKIWVNGVLRSTNTNKYPEDFLWGMNREGSISKFGEAAWGNSTDFEGYVADFYHLDGQYLDYTSFAEFNNGILIPIAPSSLTFGTNGFHLEFKENSVGSGSSSTIGADTSGEDNHLDSAVIAADDCNMPDCPENNFCVMNPLVRTSGTKAFSEGSLKIVQSGTAYSFFQSTFSMRTGKWYAECRVNSVSATLMIGISEQNMEVYRTGDNNDPHNTAGTVWYLKTGAGYVNGSSIAAGTFTSSDTYTDDDVIGIALDLDSSTRNVKFFLNGTEVNSTDLSATGFIDDIGFANNIYNGATIVWNFGQESTFAGEETATSNADANGIGAFHHAPPSGFLAVCSSNFEEPTIGPNSDTVAIDNFETVLYEGNGSTQNIAVNFKPDWVWIKNRDAADSHQIFDSSRGVTKAIFSDTNAAEGANDDTLTAFISTGFSLGDDVVVNTDDESYVAWNWKANGGTTVTNEDGSIDSTVQANTAAGFSIVTLTSPGSGTWSIGHGLGVKPDMIIQKYRTGNARWTTWHNLLTSGQYLGLNETNAIASSGTPFNFNITDTLIGGNANYDATSATVVNYVFAAVEGYSKFGVYTGNGNADGAFVYTGFRPAFILLKHSNATNSWRMFDNKRNAYNHNSEVLYASANNAEGSELAADLLSNGFKLRASTGGSNTSAGTYLYMAFAEQPFKYANAR